MASISKTIGYLRVSTVDQDLDKNKAEILRLVHDKHLGSGHVVFVEERASGKKPWRERRIAGIMEDLVEGDNLVVSEISRLGRSMLEIMENSGHRNRPENPGFCGQRRLGAVRQYAKQDHGHGVFYRG